MKLAAAGRIGATKYIFTVFKNFSDRISNDIPPQMKILNTVIPYFFHIPQMVVRTTCQR